MKSFQKTTTKSPFQNQLANRFWISTLFSSFSPILLIWSFSWFYLGLASSGSMLFVSFARKWNSLVSCLFCYFASSFWLFYSFILSRPSSLVLNLFLYPEGPFGRVHLNQVRVFLFTFSIALALYYTIQKVVKNSDKFVFSLINRSPIYKIKSLFLYRHEKYCYWSILLSVFLESLAVVASFYIFYFLFGNYIYHLNKRILGIFMP